MVRNYISETPWKSLDMNPRNTACLVVDMQNSYCSPDGSLAQSKLNGSYNTTPIQEMVPVLAGFINDLRGLGIEVVYTRMNEDPERMPPNARLKRLSIGAPPVGQLGTRDFEYFDERIRPRGEEKEYVKTMYDPFTVPDLRHHLERYENLIVTGVHGTACIPVTIMRAFTEGFNVFVPTYGKDEKLLVSTFEERMPAQESFFRMIDELFAYLTDKEELLKRLGNK